MQFLMIFLIVPILTASGTSLMLERREEIMRFFTTQQRCENEFPIDPTSTVNSETGEEINDPQADCFAACILEGMNLKMSDGKLNIDVDIPSDAPPEFANAMRSCANEQGSNKCETAHRLIECMGDHGKDIS